MAHPFFEEDILMRAVYPRSQKYANACQESINQHARGRTPLVIFEEERVLKSDYIPWISSNTSGVIYTVPTIELKSYLVDREKNWPKLIELFRLAGVKQIDVGGQYMVLTPIESNHTDDSDWFNTISQGHPNLLDQYPLAKRWLDQGLLPAGCAGALGFMFFRKGFDFSLSPISSPRYIMSIEEYIKEVRREIPRDSNYHLRPKFYPEFD